MSTEFYTADAPQTDLTPSGFLEISADVKDESRSGSELGTAVLGAQPNPAPGGAPLLDSAAASAAPSTMGGLFGALRHGMVTLTRGARGSPMPFAPVGPQQQLPPQQRPPQPVFTTPQRGSRLPVNGDTSAVPTAPLQQQVQQPLVGATAAAAADAPRAPSRLDQLMRERGEKLKLLKSAGDAVPIFTGLLAGAGSLTAVQWCGLVEEAFSSILGLQLADDLLLRDPAAVAWLTANKLQDAAKRRWDSCKQHADFPRNMAWEQFSAWLQANSQGPHPIVGLREVEQLQQREQEGLPAYTDRALTLDARVSDSVATPMAKVWHFVVGMRDHRLRQKVMEHWGADITSYHGVSMSDVAQYAAGQHAVLQLDRSIGSSGASGGSGGSRGGRGSYRGGSHNDRSRSSGGSSGVNALGGSSSDPPQNPGAPGYKGCWGCGQSDHRAVDRPDCLKKWQAERAARQAAGEGKAPRKGGK